MVMRTIMKKMKMKMTRMREVKMIMIQRRPRELLEGMGSRVNDLQSASSSEALHIEFMHTAGSGMMKVWFCLMQCH